MFINFKRKNHCFLIILGGTFTVNEKPVEILSTNNGTSLATPKSTTLNASTGNLEVILRMF